MLPFNKIMPDNNRLNALTSDRFNAPSVLIIFTVHENNSPFKLRPALLLHAGHGADYTCLGYRNSANYL